MIHGVIIERIEDYNNLKRYRVDYMKNGYSQKAIFMDWFGSGYKIHRIRALFEERSTS